MLHEIDLDELAKELRQEIQNSKKENADSTKRQQILKRLEIVEDFIRSGNKPEWMILTKIPVIPPDIRPMTQLDGGRFATSDLNDLYKRLINRNKRLREQIANQITSTVYHHELRLLQEAVDSLIDNNAQKRPMKNNSGRSLKSLSDMLKGKYGRFRQNILGKRVDFSGRTVIIVGPELKLHQCGLPTEMALELFKPFIMRKLFKKGYIYTSKKAKALIDNRDKRVYPLLDEVVKEHPVMLNRAPTLHRLNIQAFEPVLVDEKAIKLHPLVCQAFNADFDGDQIAIHIPLTSAAQIECWTLMLSTRNLLNPANGNLVVSPSQDIVLGIYYLTRAEKDVSEYKKYYNNVSEVYNAIDNKYLRYNENILYKIPETGERIETTAGRVIFNDWLPETIPFQNKCFGDKELKELIAWALKYRKNSLVIKLLDAIKDCGFKYATVFGATICSQDLITPKTKNKIINTLAQNKKELLQKFNKKEICEQEFTRGIQSLYISAEKQLASDLYIDLLTEENRCNSLYTNIKSGARGSKIQIQKICSSGGLALNSQGNLSNFFISSSLKEGYTPLEYFNSCNSLRYKLAHNPIKINLLHYLERRLIYALENIVIVENDCKSAQGIYKTQTVKDGIVVEKLAQKIIGLYSAENVINPISNEIIVKYDELITPEKAELIEQCGVKRVFVRSPLTCCSKKGICKKCYGEDLSTGRPVVIGTPVGIVAAQSIINPLVNLIFSLKHTSIIEELAKEREKSISDTILDLNRFFEVHQPTTQSILSKVEGYVANKIIGKKYYKILIKDSFTGQTVEYSIYNKKKPLVKVGDYIKCGQKLCEGEIEYEDVLSILGKYDFAIYYINLIEDYFLNLRLELNDKHLELVLKEMLSNVRILKTGSTKFEQNQIVSNDLFEKENEIMVSQSSVPAVATPTLMGVSMIRNEKSFLVRLTCSSPMEVLTSSAIAGEIDYLDGLAENVVVGNAIPAGTGMNCYSNDIQLINKPEYYDDEDEDEFIDIPEDPDY